MKSHNLHLANPSDRDWSRKSVVFAVGAYGSKLIWAWGRGIEDCLDAAIQYCADHFPGLLMNEEFESAYSEAYTRCIVEGLDEEEADCRAYEEASIDLTSDSDGNNWIASWEWQIASEDPDRKTILELQGRGKP